MTSKICSPLFIITICNSATELCFWASTLWKEQEHHKFCSSEIPQVNGHGLSLLLLVMICRTADILPLIQNREHILDLLPNPLLDITPKHQAHRNLPALRDPRARERIDDDPGSFRDISDLMTIRRVQPGSRLPHHRTFVLSDPRFRSDTCPRAQKVRAEVPRLDDAGVYAERLELESQRLGEGGHGDLGGGVNAKGRAGGSACQAAEGGHDASGMATEIGQEGARDVQSAEDVGGELVGCFLRTWGWLITYFLNSRPLVPCFFHRGVEDVSCSIDQVRDLSVLFHNVCCDRFQILEVTGDIEINAIAPARRRLLSFDALRAVATTRPPFARAAWAMLSPKPPLSR